MLTALCRAVTIAKTTHTLFAAAPKTLTLLHLPDRTIDIVPLRRDADVGGADTCTHSHTNSHTHALSSTIPPQVSDGVSGSAAVLSAAGVSDAAGSGGHGEQKAATEDLSVTSSETDTKLEQMVRVYAGGGVLLFSFFRVIVCTWLSFLMHFCDSVRTVCVHLYAVLQAEATSVAGRTVA